MGAVGAGIINSTKGYDQGTGVFESRPGISIRP